MRRRALPNANRDEKDKEKQLDHDIACFETYQQHWQQLEDAMNDSKVRLHYVLKFHIQNLIFDLKLIKKF